MDNRSRRVLHLVAGIYLIYLSGKLITDQLQAPTSNAIIAWAAAIAFGVFGIFIVIRYFRTSVKDYHEQENQESEVIEENVDEE